MLEEIKKELTSIKLLTTLLTIAVVIYLLQIGWTLFTSFSDIVTMLFIAWILSFLMEPVVKRAARITRLNLAWATLIIYLVFAAVFGLVIYMFVPPLYSQVLQLEKTIPVFLAKSPPLIQKASHSISASFNNYVYLIPLGAQFFLSFFIILIISFYLIVEKEEINEEIYNLTPQKWHEHVRFIQNVIDTTFASFFRVQFILAAITGVVTWIVLQIFGINFAPSTGVLSGLFTLIPFVGQVAGFVLPVFVAFITDPTKAILVFIILGIAQQVIFNIYGPKLLGKTFKIHPLIVFISFFIGVKIYGIIGGVFAVPVLGIIILTFNELKHHYKPRRT